MRLARLVLMMFLVAGWAAAQCGAQTMAAGDKSKKDSTAAGHKGMSCCCCQHMGSKDAHHKDAMKDDHKDAAESEAKSEGGMGCCAKMGKDKDASGGGMSCGKKDDAKAGTTEQKMK